MATFTFTALPQDDKLIGGAGNDTFTVNAVTDLTNTDVAVGGDGVDTLLINDSAAMVDGRFDSLAAIENLVFSKSVTSVDLVAGVRFGQAGLTHIDAKLVAGTVKVDASKDLAGGLVIDGGTGDNTLTGSIKNDVFRIKADTLDGADFVDGNGHALLALHPDLENLRGDVLELWSDKAVTIDDTFNDIHGIQTLSLAGKGPFTVNLENRSEAAGIGLVDASAATGNVIVDASLRSEAVTVAFTSKGLTASDVVIGNSLNTTLGITDKAAVVDAAFKQIQNVSNLTVFGDAGTADYTGAKVTIGALSSAAGIDTVTNASNYGLTLDASARLDGITFNGNIGNDVMIAANLAAPGQVFNAGAGDDSLKIKLAAWDDSFVYDGGAGIDEIRVTDAVAGQKVVDDDFENVKNVERLVFEATGAQEVTLDTKAQNAGLTTVDGSKNTTSLLVNATAMGNTELSVYAGTGANTIILGGNNINGAGHIFMTAKSFGTNDQLAGQANDAQLHFTDAVKLTDANFKGIVNVEDFGLLALDNAAKGQSLIGGTEFAKFLNTKAIASIDATSTDVNSSFTFDFSKVTGLSINDFLVSGGEGNDTFIAGNDPNVYLHGDGGNDLVQVGSGIFNKQVFNGGDGTDTVVLLDSGAIGSDAFGKYSEVETLRLAAAKGAGYSLVLGTNSVKAGIETVDGSLAGVDVTIDASGRGTDAVTLIGGAKTNILTGTDGDDTFGVAAKTLNDGDKLDGGDGVNTLFFTTGGVVGKNADLQDFTVFKLNDAGNTFTLGDTTGDFGDNTSLTVAGVSVPGFSAVVEGGKGSDKVDFSITFGSFGFVSNGGSDTFIGAAGFNIYLFDQPGELTGADKVIGNANANDGVFAAAGTYTSDQFKGFKSVDLFGTVSADPAAGSSITLKNDFVAGLGGQLFKVGTSFDGLGTGNDVVDASAVTDALSSLEFVSGFGADRLLGGAGSDQFDFSTFGGTSALDQNDVVAGGDGYDLMQFTVADTATLDDSNFAGVSGVEYLRFLNFGGTNADITLGTNAAKAGIDTVDNALLDATDKLTLDATNYADGTSQLDGINVLLTGASAEDLTLSKADDTVAIRLNSNLDGTDDKIDGGGSTGLFGGTDRIEFWGSSFFNAGNTDITDAQFAGVTGIGTVAVMADTAKITLGTNASKGVTIVDATQALVGMEIDVAAMTNGVTVRGSAFADTILGTDQGDVIIGGGGLDTLTGGKGSDTFVFLQGSDSGLFNGKPASATNAFGEDEITDFTAGDKIDLSAFSLAKQSINNAVAGGIPPADGDTKIFQNDGVAVIHSGSDSLVFIDANNNGKFDSKADLVFAATDATSELTKLGSYVFSGGGTTNTLPLLGEVGSNNMDLLPGTGKNPITDDSTFAGQTIDKLTLLGSTGIHTIILSENSEEAGITFVDGTNAPGTVNISADGRLLGITIDSGAAINNLFGGRGDDRFIFTGTGLTAKDKVDGGDGQDVLQITTGTGKAAIVDAAFTQVTGVEILDFQVDPLATAPSDFSGQKVILGKVSQVAGIDQVLNDTVAFGLTVDASARTDGVRFDGASLNDVFIASSGVDFFDGGNGEDSMGIKLAALTKDDTFIGGQGIDTLHILDSFDAKVADTDIVGADFSNVYGVERLVFDAAGHQDVTLTVDQGLQVVDASKVSKGLTLTSQMTENLQVIAGTGDDTISFTDLGEVFIASTKLNGKDHITGNGNTTLHFTDAVKLTDAYFATLTNVTGVDRWALDSDAKGQTAVFGTAFAELAKTGGIETIEGNQITNGVTYDFSRYTHTAAKGLTVEGGAGADIFLVDDRDQLSAVNVGLKFDGGAGADTFKVGSFWLGKNTITGGAGDDTLYVLDNTGSVDDASQFGSGKIEDVDNIVLGVQKVSTYTVTLGTNMAAAGVKVVDASAAAVNVFVNGAAFTNSLTAIAGTKVNDFVGGAKDDTFKFAVTGFGADDSVDGDIGTDKLVLTTGGTVAAGAFVNVSQVEQLFLSKSGNTVTLSDALIAGSDGGVTTFAMAANPFDFYVRGEVGNDKVDLSQLTDPSKSIAVEGLLGNDQFTGSAGDDNFLFLVQLGSFTAADVVKGGAGNDTLWLLDGTYGTDIFKGMTSIEHINVNDGSGTGTAKFTLNNDSFKGADLQDDGAKSMTIEFLNGGKDHVVNAAAVTNTSFGVEVIFSATQDVTFTGGAGGDTIAFRNVGSGGGEYALTAGDTVDGGAGRDTLLLIDSFGVGSIVDAAFAGVSHVERIVTEKSAALTIAANAEKAGIEEVDAAGAGGVLLLDASGFSSDLVVRGDKFHDVLTLGAGDDTIIGGGQNDTLEGGLGADTFVYQAASDSVLGNADNAGQLDLIKDYDRSQGDVIDLTRLALFDKQADDLGFSASLTLLRQNVEATGFLTFSVLIGNDGADTYIFADTDGSGAFTFAGDSVIKVSGVHGNDLIDGLVM